MALFYRGAGPGTYWHLNDPYRRGFIPHSPKAIPSTARLISHIAQGTIASPYISLTRSFAIARAYALQGPGGFATASQPGLIFELDISDKILRRMIDPLKEIAKALPEPWIDPHYQHNGDQRFLLGIVNPVAMRTHLQRQCIFPPGSGATPQTPNLSRELAALTRVLRDAEILVRGVIPRAHIAHRYEVY